MTIAWSGFPAPVAATASDVMVGLAGGTANARFNANSWLFAADNLSDLADVPTALNNLGLGAASNVSFASVTTTGFNKVATTNAITAHAGGGQGSATALTTPINRITTVATSGDSVLLPASVAGESCVVINAAAANPADIFPHSGDAINALAINTALSLAANKTVIFYCAVAGTWNSVLTA